MKLIFKEMFEPCVPSMYKTAQSLCEKNEIIIGHFIHHPIQTAAEKAGRPYITVTLNHGGIPTRYSPPIPYPDLGESINLLIWKFSEKIIGLILLPLINDLFVNQGQTGGIIKKSAVFSKTTDWQIIGKCLKT